MVTVHFIICATAAGGSLLTLKFLHFIDEYNYFDLRIFWHDYLFQRKSWSFSEQRVFLQTGQHCI